MTLPDNGIMQTARLVRPAPEGRIHDHVPRAPKESRMTAPATPRSPFLERLAQTPRHRRRRGDGHHALQPGRAGQRLLRRVQPHRSPAWCMDIHEAYIQAGAEIIETNTYGANRFKLGTYDLADKVRAINARGAKLARNAREITGVPVFVAGSVGPLGRPVQPLGRISLAEAARHFPRADRRPALRRGGPDHARNVQGPATRCWWRCAPPARPATCRSSPR